MKLSYDQKLMRLCKSGKSVNDGLNLVNQMRDKNIKLSHYTLSALLNACIYSKTYDKYQFIWYKCINEYNIKPNCVSYILAISAASYCNNHQHIEQLIIEMNKYPKDIMKQFHWNQLFDSLGRISNIQSLLTLYDEMKLNSKYDGDKYTLSILLNTLIKCMV